MNLLLALTESTLGRAKLTCDWRGAAAQQLAIRNFPKSWSPFAMALTSHAELFADPDNSLSGPGRALGHAKTFARWSSTSNAPATAEVQHNVLKDFDAPVGVVGF